MYNKSPFKQNGNSSDKELIDISSDDDVSKAESKVNKDTNNSEAYNETEESVHITPSVTLKVEIPATKTQSPQVPTVVYIICV